jgi:hypothetical protein
MSDTREDLRRATKITSVVRGGGVRGLLTVRVNLDFDGGGWNGWTHGWIQSFGDLVLRDDAECDTFVREICAIFGHSDPDRLVGQACVALYSHLGSKVEGIEAPSGKRWTIRGFLLRHYPDKALTPTEIYRHALQARVVHANRELERAVKELAEVEPLIDWEVEP